MLVWNYTVHNDPFIGLMKTKSKGSARNCVGNEGTLAKVIAALLANVKAESASLIESKMMNITQSKKKTNKFVAEIESFTSDLKRAYITEGVPIASADTLATNSACKSMRQNAQISSIVK